MILIAMLHVHFIFALGPSIAQLIVLIISLQQNYFQWQAQHLLP